MSFTKKQKESIHKALKNFECEELKNGVLDILEKDVDFAKAKDITGCVFKIAYPSLYTTGFDPQEKYKIMNEASAELYDILNEE
jgi:hypothetical protein